MTEKPARKIGKYEYQDKTPFYNAWKADGKKGKGKGKKGSGRPFNDNPWRPENSCNDWGRSWASSPSWSNTTWQRDSDQEKLVAWEDRDSHKE